MNNMRSVSYYSITQEVMIGGDYIEIVRYAGAGPFAVLDSGEAITSTVNVDRVPVHCVRRCISVPGVIGIDGYPAKEIAESYIAISPPLRELIESPIRTEAEREKAEIRNVLNSVRNRAEQLAKNLDFLTNAPWYVRIWRALRPTGETP